MGTREAVLKFLVQLKALASKNFDFVWTEKNKRAMIKLGYTGKQDVLLHIMNLAVQDYVKGPCPDDNPKMPEAVWVFAPEINDETFYVKVKIIGSQVRCLSFHEAEKPIQQYPFRKK